MSANLMGEPLLSPPEILSQTKERIFYLFQEDSFSNNIYSYFFSKNIIISSRYTIFNFLPKNLFEQFRRLANVYFLVLGIIALIGTYTQVYETAVEPAGILGPMIIVVFISVIKDGFEDIKRHKADDKVNRQLVKKVLSTGEVVEIMWEDITVGDILLMKCDDELPCDGVSLYSGGVQGQCCYVETAAIDGETNLKLKYTIHSLLSTKKDNNDSTLSSPISSPTPTFTYNESENKITGPLHTLNYYIYAEAPNSSTHRFNASLGIPENVPNLVKDLDINEEKNPKSFKVKLKKFWGSIKYYLGFSNPQSSSRLNKPATLTLPSATQTVSLNEKNLLLRGSILRATEWTLLACVYQGKDTKLMRNSKLTPSKLSNIDRIVNKTLAVSITTMLVVCVISMVFGVVWMMDDKDATYLCLNKDDLDDRFTNSDGEGGCTSAATSSVLTIFTFATLYNNFVCISMYVSLEMVYLCQSFFLTNDLRLYDEASDTPAECHSSGMCADLGQVQYVLSDKTGTLTKNHMVVKLFSLTDKIFGEVLDNTNENGEETNNNNNNKGINYFINSFLTGTNSSAPKAPAAITNSSHKSGVDSTRPSFISEKNFDFTLPDDVTALVIQNTDPYPQIESIQNLSPNTTSPLVFNNSKAPTALAHTMLLQFIRVLVYCNTAMIMPDANGSQTLADIPQLNERLQAESPDEVALILSAAQECDVLLENRTIRNMTSRGMPYYYLDTEKSNSLKQQKEEVEILAVNEFDSNRKMMSILVKFTKKESIGSNLLKSQYMLFCKGADSSILKVSNGEKKNSSVSKNELESWTSHCKAHIDYFANLGLRTLALSYKELTEQEVNTWLAKYNEASNSLVNRKNAMTSCALEIEQDLILVGAVGIEDELQDEVGASIATMQAMGINVWMITGDKVETAIAIGKKCSLIESRHHIEKLVGLNSSNLGPALLKIYNLLNINGNIPTVDTIDNNPIHTPLQTATENPLLNKELALIVDGSTMEVIESDKTFAYLFIKIAQNSPTVIASRVSPLQKASLVRMVKNSPQRPVTLGIGDGANDVGMIHEARVGVGISGKEGRHAANAADFAIAQFKFLVILLMEHGRFNYIRCSKLVLYSFFKNLVLVSMLFYYSSYSGYSGTMPLDSIVFSGFNFYLGLPILVIGATDFDIPRNRVYDFPLDAYKTGRLGELLNVKNMTRWCVFAFVQGLLLFTICIRFISGPTTIKNDGTGAGYFKFSIYGTGLNDIDSGSALGMYSDGFLLYTTVVLAMHIKVVTMFDHPNLIFWVLWFLSFAGYILFTAVYSLFPTLEWFGVFTNSLKQPQFYLACFLVPFLLVICDYVVDNLFVKYDPSSQNILHKKLEKYEKLENESWLSINSIFKNKKKNIPVNNDDCMESPSALYSSFSSTTEFKGNNPSTSLSFNSSNSSSQSKSILLSQTKSPKEDSSVRNNNSFDEIYLKSQPQSVAIMQLTPSASPYQSRSPSSYSSMN